MGRAAAARAHGEPPEALSIAATDSSGRPALVRLNEGLALRAGERWHYLCPASWGEDVITPAHQIPGGSAVIGSGRGLWLVSAAGELVPHPDPAAEGRVLSLAASEGGLFALRRLGERYEVLEVDERRVRVLFGGTEPWADLAASGDTLQLVRWQDGRIRELRLSLAGDVLGEAEANAPAGSIAAVARLAGDVPYVLALTNSLGAELGRLEQGEFRSLLSGRGLGGPLAVGGRWLVAADGQLARFDEERWELLEDGASVTCLRRHFELAYACSDRGLRALTAQGLGELLFELRALLPPDLARVPSEEREECRLQWQRYAIDLRSIGIELEPPAEGPQAGASDAGPGPGEQDASPEAPDAGSAATVRESGCAIVHAPPRGAANALALAALACWIGYVGRARSRRR